MFTIKAKQQTPVTEVFFVLIISLSYILVIILSSVMNDYDFHSTQLFKNLL